jgi:hypothetical protein
MGGGPRGWRRASEVAIRGTSSGGKDERLGDDISIVLNHVSTLLKTLLGHRRTAPISRVVYK